MALPFDEVRKVVTFMGELGQRVGAREFPAHLVNLVEMIMPGVIVAFDEIPARDKYRLTHNVPLDHAASMRIFGVLSTCYQENPIYEFIQRATDVSAVRISDLASRQRFCRTTLYHEVFRPLEIEYQMHVVIPVKAGARRSRSITGGISPRSKRASSNC
jgi:hypothetical protein